MPTFTIICVIQWILLYFSTHLLSLKAYNCAGFRPPKCGNLTIPYPFRLNNTSCGLPGFEITCKEKSSSKPEIPYLRTLTGDVQVLNISYDHILVDATHLFAFPCNSRNVNDTISKTFNLSDEGPLRISELNRFFAVGCDTYGKFEMFFNSKSEDWPYSGSCPSSCIYNQTLYGKRPLCKENGCCEMPVPGGYVRISLSTQVYNSPNPIGENGKDSCNNSAVAIVDKDSWDSISNSTTFKASGSSLRVDWAILNGACSSAQAANSSYQCSLNNTECENRDWGYVCKCKTGYNGDGYSNGTGCKEIEKSASDIKKCRSLSCFQTLSIVTGVCGTLIAVLLGGGTLFWIFKIRKYKREKEENFQRNGGNQLKELMSNRGGEIGMKFFSFEELEKATNRFSENLILGAGGYGTVYKGTLTDRRVVAVKKSKAVDPKEKDQFINEVSILSQIIHRNVVKLLGCCLESSVPLLVYEYISNGTLFDHLHGNKQEQQPLPWERRLSIATGTAEALSYMHSGAKVPIVHRDVKSSNILLDNDYNPKVADFGVSRLVPMGQTHITTAVQGTPGYMDPECFQKDQLTEKSDVYSFGVVLVELLTGLKPVPYDRMKNDSNLATFFVSTVNTSVLKKVIDPRLNVDEGKNMESMSSVARLAKKCLSVEGEKRPLMKIVVQELLSAKDGVTNDLAENPEEMVEPTADEEERIDRIRSAHSVPHQSSSSFSIEGLVHDVTSGR